MPKLSPKVDVKVVMLGKEFSGKTSIVERFLNERFVGENKYQSTIGAAYGARKMTVGKREVILGVWDTAGSERYESMTRMYYRGAKAAVVCYAVNDEQSWEKLQFWISELKKMEENCRIYICATKIDLLQGNNRNRVIDYHNTTDYSYDINAKIYETSSKTGTNIIEMFQEIAEDYIENEDVPDYHEFNETKLQSKHMESRSSCCGSRSGT